MNNKKNNIMKNTNNIKAIKIDITYAYRHDVENLILDLDDLKIGNGFKYKLNWLVHDNACPWEKFSYDNIYIKTEGQSKKLINKLTSFLYNDGWTDFEIIY